MAASRTALDSTQGWLRASSVRQSSYSWQPPPAGGGLGGEVAVVAVAVTATPSPSPTSRIVAVTRSRNTRSWVMASTVPRCAAQVLLQPAHGLVVQVVGRLVEQQQFGCGREGGGQGQPGPLAAGQGAERRRGRDPAGRARAGRCPPGRPPRSRRAPRSGRPDRRRVQRAVERLPGQAASPASARRIRRLEVAQVGQREIDGVLDRGPGGRSSDWARYPTPPGATTVTSPLSGRSRPAMSSQQGGLARAVVADDAGLLAGLDGEGHLGRARRGRRNVLVTSLSAIWVGCGARMSLSRSGGCRWSAHIDGPLGRRTATRGAARTAEPGSTRSRTRRSAKIDHRNRKPMPPTVRHGGPLGKTIRLVSSYSTNMRWSGQRSVHTWGWTEGDGWRAGRCGARPWALEWRGFTDRSHLRRGRRCGPGRPVPYFCGCERPVLLRRRGRRAGSPGGGRCRGPGRAARVVVGRCPGSARRRRR